MALTDETAILADGSVIQEELKGQR